LDQPSDNQEPQQTPTGSSPSENPEQRTLGDFVIRREIGRGGMGTVYEAWQTSLQRVVALKVLAPHVSASPKAIIRFIREAQAAAKLHHTNIVPIFAQGEADGIHYYAMEYIRGSGLNDIIGELRGAEKSEYTPSQLAETVDLSAADTATVISDATNDNEPPASDSAVTLTAPSKTHTTQAFYNDVTNHAACVADALDYAHECGVVHRDIKPHNLILGTDGHIRISDFGLARLAEQPGVTTTGEMIGSPLYMAPEQITGSVGDVDHRADIFSLGATLYEWLTLTPPYPGETRERVISRILTSDAPAPRTINPDIPIDLETIVLKAIEKDPSRRYQTAGELRDDLRRFLASRPIVARRAGLHTRAAKFIARHQLAAVGMIALLVAGTLFVTLRQTQKREAKQRAAAVQARADAAVVQQDNEQLLYAISLFQGGPTTLAEAAFSGVQGIVGESVKGDSNDEDGEESIALPEIGTPTGIGLTVVEDYYLSVAPNDWPPEPASGDDAGRHLYAAVLHWLDDEVVEARRLLASYIDLEPNDFDALQLYAILACLSGHFDEVSTAGNRMAMFPGHTVDGAIWVGISDFLLNRPKQALASLERALEIDDTRDLVRVLHGLSAIPIGKTEVAMQDFDAVSTRDPESVPAMLGRTSALFASGRYDEAIPVATRVLDLSSAGHSRAHALALRGDCRSTLGDHEAAANDYQEAIDIEGQTLALMVKKATAQYQLINRKRIARQQTEPQATGDAPAGSPQAQKENQQPVGPLFDFLNRRPKQGKSPQGDLEFPFRKIIPTRDGR
jgi:serine/threonine protein kinase